MLGWRHYTASSFRLPVPAGAGSFGAWVTIDRSGAVTVAVPHAEMGQGVFTAIPMLVAEELDCDPSRVRAIPAPLHAAYVNPLIVLDGLGLKPQSEPLSEVAYWTLERLLRLVGAQVTGGSTSLRNTWIAAREAGASARALLLAAAADRWNVPVGRLRTLQGRVVDPVANRYLPYGELAVDAAGRTPTRAPLKSREQFRLIGRNMPRVDAKSRTDGSLQFGIDVRLPGLLYAAIRQSPTLGSRLIRAELPDDGTRALATLVAGEHFYAVVAKSWWRAERIADKVLAQWQSSDEPALSTAAIHDSLTAALDSPDARVFEARGEPEKALGQARRKVSAQYRLGVAAHAAMEPLNCTIRLGAEACDVWVGTQAPTLVQQVVAKSAGLSRNQVRLHSMSMGGSFGRRLEPEVAQQAVAIARALPAGTPVQLIWSREQDLRHDCFRPAAAASVQAALGARGELLALDFRAAGVSVLDQYAKRALGIRWPRLPDRGVIDGVAGCAYDIPGFKVSHTRVDSSLPAGFWRGVGYSTNTFFLESFIDECAHAAGEDPYQYRRRHLQREPGVLRVLEEAARVSGWGRPVATRRGVRGGRGIALVQGFGSTLCLVVEAEVEANAIRVPRAFAVIDCGLAIDRVNVRAQVAGAIVFALSAALHGPVEVVSGAVKPSNFHELSLPLMSNSPRIQVEIIDSGAPIGGVGELGVPALAPALANAVFAASGKRLRELPLRLA